MREKTTNFKDFIGQLITRLKGGDKRFKDTIMQKSPPSDPPQRWWGREYLSLADPERVLEELGLILDVLPQNYWLEVWDNISAEVQQQIIGQLMEVTADG